jgi:hypothetical protein
VRINGDCFDKIFNTRNHAVLTGASRQRAEHNRICVSLDSPTSSFAIAKARAAINDQRNRSFFPASQDVTIALRGSKPISPLSRSTMETEYELRRSLRQRRQFRAAMMITLGSKPPESRMADTPGRTRPAERGLSTCNEC